MLELSPNHPTAYLLCASIVLVSNDDKACCALFRMATPSWPAPGIPGGNDPCEINCSAAQAALCGGALHIANRLTENSSIIPSPHWRDDDWMDEARSSTQTLGDSPLSFPQAFVMLCSGAERQKWPSTRARFIELCSSYFGRPPDQTLDATKAYRSDVFWTAIRRSALILHERSTMDQSARHPEQAFGHTYRL